MEANNDSAIQFELRSESLQEQLDAANQRAADAWAQVEAIAVKGLGLPEVDESDEIPPEWNSSGTLSELVRNWKDCAEAAERKLASLADSFRLFLDECEDLDSDVRCSRCPGVKAIDKARRALAQIDQPQSTPTDTLTTGDVIDESALAMAQAVIQNAMTESGISQSELAREMNCNRSFVSRMLSGDYNLTVKTMAKAMAACGFEIRFTIVRSKSDQP